MDCIFCKIGAGLIPCKKIYEDESVLSFHDINPAAKIHALVIPKSHIASANEITDENAATVAKIFAAIPKIADSLQLRGGYRIISNCGADASQSVPHLHFHILGGEQLTPSLN